MNSNILDLFRNIQLNEKKLHFIYMNFEAFTTLHGFTTHKTST